MPVQSDQFGFVFRHLVELNFYHCTLHITEFSGDHRGLFLVLFQENDATLVRQQHSRTPCLGQRDDPPFVLLPVPRQREGEFQSRGAHLQGVAGAEVQLLCLFGLIEDPGDFLADFLNRIQIGTVGGGIFRINGNPNCGFSARFGDLDIFHDHPKLGEQGVQGIGQLFWSGKGHVHEH